MPPAVIAVPATISGRAPVRAMTWLTIPETTTMVPANGRNARPDFSAL